MFREHPKDAAGKYRLAIAGLMLLSLAALLVTIWVEFDFIREQALVEELMRQLPSGATASAKELAGQLRWQFRLTILVVLNLVVTGIAVAILWRAYQSSQDSLRDIKALANDVLSSMDQAVITTDLDGRITSINRRGMEFLSTDPGCIGGPLQELCTEIPLEEFRADWQQFKSPAVTRDFKANLKGTERTLRAFCQVLNDHAGDEIGNVLQLRDVTRRVLIEDRMLRMERYMGLGSLAAGLHHEIKNPLAALSLHVQLLEECIEYGEAPADADQMLEVIKMELKRIGSVLESFREFTSVGRLNLISLGQSELVDLVRRQVNLIIPQAERSGIKVCFAVRGDWSADVTADPVRLEQVLLNLFINAIEAMPAGGSLSISLAEVGDSVEIEVGDTGKGIPEDLRDRIYDPYFTTKGQGTGLGLALCDKIVRQHHGSLDFRTSTGGTTFTVSLPAAQKPGIS